MGDNPSSTDVCYSQLCVCERECVYLCVSVCVNPLNDHGTKSFWLRFSSSAGEEGGWRKGKRRARLHPSELHEARKTELMLGDGNRSRNGETANTVTQPLTVRRSTRMKQSNRAKRSGWRTLIGIIRSMRHLRPPQL